MISNSISILSFHTLRTSRGIKQITTTMTGMEFIYGLGLAMMIVPLINYTIALAVIGRHTVFIALNSCHFQRRVGKLSSILSKNFLEIFSIFRKRNTSAKIRWAKPPHRSNPNTGNRISPFLSVYLHCWTLLMAMAIPQLIYDISVWSSENERLKSTYAMFWSGVSEL